MDKQVFLKSESKSGYIKYTNIKFIDGYVNVKSNGVENKILLDYIESKLYLEDIFLDNENIEPIYIKCYYTDKGERLFERDGITFVRLDRIQHVIFEQGKMMRLKCKDINNKYFALVDLEYEKAFYNYLEKHCI